ncbi:MAG: NAD regulator [Caulobacterales bacterium]
MPLREDAHAVIGLTAVIVAADANEPYVLVTRQATSDGLAGLPFGPFDPARHRTFELGLRTFITDQTGFDAAYVEQLYTFGDRGREAPRADLGGGAAERVISIGYLAIAPERTDLQGAEAAWQEWYRYFPWEDWRGGRPAIIATLLAPRLIAWASAGGNESETASRLGRVRLHFALDGAPWVEERALERYELLYEAGLAPEAQRDRMRERTKSERTPQPMAATPGLGEPMGSDHRRILATAIGRLRAKLKYRPIIFDLLQRDFTLSELQHVAESVLGLSLHKQNFRRMVEHAGLVEATGAVESGTGGRPAALFRFRREVLAERAAGGIAAPRAHRLTGPEHN